MGEAGSAQARDIIEDRPGVETELGDDLGGEPRRFGCGDLFRKRAIKLAGSDAQMTLGIAGDADRADAVPARQSAMDDVSGPL